ncbi:hypothetical protein DO97_01030 [Neosynechococcus sphagnicola sy1]|uniref:Uncharacterized protein n=2 Tax=Neosynechococcus TaxID=1501143 RepID=A0A098TQZ6_9CYAN|nr:hypothetical protein DO97_01030 [Neosynechococcus sphagnicola sy1]
MFLGAILGVDWGKAWLKQPHPPGIKPAMMETLPPELSPMVQVSVHLVQSWGGIGRNGQFSDFTVSTISEPPDPTLLLLALLPVSLYYHENAVLQSQKLQQYLRAITPTQAPHWSAIAASSRVLGVTSSLLAKNICNPDTLLSHLQIDLQTAPTDFSDPATVERLVQSLAQLQRLWERGASLVNVQANLDTLRLSPCLQSTVMALYCWLSTPPTLP